MISYKYKFIFIHIPKTGGNSIQRILKEYSEDEIVASGDQCGIERFGVINKELETSKHASTGRYYDALGEREFEKFFKFTCIRNPFDRMVSWYFSPHKGITTWNKKEFIDLSRSFIEKYGSQYEMMSINNESAMDYTIRFESLQEDFDKVCDKIGIPKQKLPHVNQSAHEHYSKYYDDESRAAIEELCKKDIESFDYNFEKK